MAVQSPQAPQSFIRFLERALQRERLSHAYLLAGGSIAALEDLAKAFARSLDCENRQSADQRGREACGKCARCIAIAEDRHPDVQWLRPESKSRVITIEQIRELMQFIQLKPTDAPFKVGIVVAADRLNIQAANAFLKTLEEPPERSLLLLLSTEPDRVLVTIRSRCLRLSLGMETSLSENDPKKIWVGKFAGVAAEGGKTFLDRYVLLGSLLSYLKEIRGSVESALGARSPLEKYDDIEPGLKEKWEDELSASIEAEYRRERYLLLRVLQFWLRDVWLSSLGLGDDLLGFKELAKLSKVIGGRLSSAEAMENLKVLEETQRLLGSNVQEALALEVGLLRLRL